MRWIINCRFLSRTEVAYGEMGMCSARNSVVGPRDCADCSIGGTTELAE